jgi:glycine cleavage system H protein
MGFILPVTYYYTKNHEWICMDDGVGSIGITHYSVARMGLIIHIHLPPNHMVRKGNRLCEIESSKVILDMECPLSGTIEEINQCVLDSPELITHDPYTSWIVRVRLTEPGELRELMTLIEYEDFIRELWKN